MVKKRTFFQTVKSFTNSYNPFNLKSSITDLNKKLGILQRAQRPEQFNYEYYKNSVAWKYPFATRTVRVIAEYSDTVTGMHVALRTETFRNGVEVVPAEEVADELDFEEEESFEANKEDRRLIIKFLENINFNKQHVLDVLDELEDDYNIMDFAVMYLRFAYEWDDDGVITQKEIREVIRQDPSFIYLVQNIRQEFGRDDDGNKLMATIDDRHTVVTIKPGEPEVNNQGKKLYPVYYSQQERGGQYYYFGWEMIHDSRYRPGKGTGFSPIMTAWLKIRTLQQQDKFILDSFEGRRPPKGMLVFGTANEESLKEAWDGMIQRAKEDPQLPAIMGVPPAANGSTSGKFVEFIDFMKSMNDLQFTAQRQNFENTLGALYGVSPILRSDTSGGGGLNNEGMQFTVTNRRVESNQARYNRKFLQGIIDALQIKGWVIKLRPSEELDEMAKLDRLQKSLEIGERAVRLGLDVDYNPKTGEVVIKEGNLETPSEPFNSFGSTPGFGGNSLPSSPNGSSSGSPEKPNTDASKSLDTVNKVDATSGFRKLQKLMQNEIDKFLKIFKRKPSEKELDSLVDKVNKRLNIELKDISKKIFKKEYLKSMGKVENELNLNFTFDKVDKNALEVLATQKVLTDSFTGLSNDMSKGIKDIITRAYKREKGLSLAQINKEIQELSKVSDSKAENIARTETGKVQSAARHVSYKKFDPEGDKLEYKHIGPSDSRTTKTSKNIKKETENWVSWNDYVKTMVKESNKEFPTWTVDKNAPLSHWQSRHTYIARKKQ